MYPYIESERLNAACKAAADSLGMDIQVFKRAVFEDKQREYDRQDIINWLDEEGYVYTDDDVDQILSTLRDDWDADRGTWSNIESAYYNNNMHLPHEDDEPEEEEEEDDELGCTVTFPFCNKCKYADECEAYQHARQAQEEAEQMMMDVFKHDTTGCESFEPAEGECTTCDSHCPLHADCPTVMERLKKLEEEISDE